VKKNLKSLERKLIRIKNQLDLAPKEMKREFGWLLLKETLKKDFKGVMWAYEELGRLVEEEFN
jgi:hypothetical protein